MQKCLLVKYNKSEQCEMASIMAKRRFSLLQGFKAIIFGFDDASFQSFKKVSKLQHDLYVFLAL